MKHMHSIVLAIFAFGSIGLSVQSLSAQTKNPDPTIPERVQSPTPGNQPQGMAGMSADDIKKIKEALKAKGHEPGPMDGTWDSKTQQALRDFQQANKLQVTGTLDAQTAEKLGVASGGQKTPSQPRSQDSGTPKGKTGTD